jgi:peptidoglycan/LPS O-acetylase OafA/YrhL
MLRRGNEELGGLCLIWLMHAGLAVVLTAPIVLLSLGRVEWRWWEASVFVLPFVIWAMLFTSELSLGKSLANLGEPFYFGFAIPAAALLRVVMARRVPERLCGAILVAAVCGAAVAVFFLTPPLPE